MTATTKSENDGAFQEVFLLGVTKKGGSEIQFAGVSEDITPDVADKAGESVVLGNGGRLWKRTPEGDYEFTIKMYPLGESVNSGESFMQYFLGTTDASAPFSATNSRVRDLFQVVVCWSDDPSITTASGTAAANYATKRFIYKNAYCTSCKPSFGDKILSAEVKFTMPAYNKSGTGNFTIEGTGSQDSVAIPAVAVYS